MTSISTALNSSTTMHGVFLSVFDRGVLLIGPSGIGKSHAALRLISNGHRLIADDIVLLKKDQQVYGSCPAQLQDFLQVDSLGVVNIRAMFGDQAIEKNKSVELVIRLVAKQPSNSDELSALHGLQTQIEIDGIEVPQISIPVTSNGDLAVLIECAVRNQNLKLNGYDAAQDFINRHQQFIKREDL